MLNRSLDDFAVYILSHGRAETIKTVRLLEEGNYTGDWYIVIDDEDSQAEMYFQRFGKEKVIQFNKKEEASLTDAGDTDFENRRVGVFARNAIQRIAIKMGYKYHIQLDDDFTQLGFRKVDEKKSLKYYQTKQLDKVFSSLLTFMDKTPAAWLSFSLSSDYIGGPKSDRYQKGLFPKTMGSFLLRADQPLWFMMRMNDDITTSIYWEHRGRLGFSISPLHMQTPPTQLEKGGMTEAYVNMGTYRKSFYTVMTCPSFAKISKQGIKFFRIHHRISWEHCNPKILCEKWKKAE